MADETLLGGTNHLTPFLQQHRRYLAANNADFREVLKLVPERPRAVVEGMGGIGTQSVIIQETWPQVHHIAYEHDVDCFNQLKERSGVDAIRAQWDGRTDFTSGTLLVLDSNTFTIHPRRLEAYRWMFNPTAEWVILTDVASGKLHLHPQAYGLRDGLLKDERLGAYVDKVAEVLGYDLLGWRKTKGFVTYIVMQRRHG